MSEAVVRVGIAGAGPWVELFHGPAFSRSDATRLKGIWARRPEAAAALAGQFQTQAFEDFDALLDACDAVVVAVAPAAQPALARRAAYAGKPLLLEKPLAQDHSEATELVEELEAAGVPTLVLLTSRFIPEVNDFLRSINRAAILGGRVANLSDALLGGPFSTSPWRHAEGALADVGPHTIDLASSAFGAVSDLDADEEGGLTVLQLRHDSGAVSQLCLSLRVPGDPRFVLEVYGHDGARSLDVLALTRKARERGDLTATVARALADAARGRRGDYPDARHALEAEWTIARARTKLEEQRKLMLGPQRVGAVQTTLEKEA
ncbi:MAG TPA: Gfo/Idh/MocA family oxidoreductase [Gaiellaceae bacterium]|nr:Gfo/Idh/MocA family oxidoreductase [Gaiellaceae bacterium]